METIVNLFFFKEIHILHNTGEINKIYKAGDKNK